MTGQLIDLSDLRDALLAGGLDILAVERICDVTRSAVAQLNHGDLQRWLAALQNLPDSPLERDNILVSIDNDTVSVDFTHPLQPQIRGEIEQALTQLKPWRKGPYSIAGIHIDTEWRSDWKWQRLEPYIQPLQGKAVLDVGCGNGYHGWRMRGAGAQLVLGIDPSPLFLVQFLALQHFIEDRAFQMLPLKMEALPDNLGQFDSVFSMGVLYHRRDHQAHLEELMGALKPGGELVLETLIVPGTGQTLVSPAEHDPGRYARMRNVWALPTQSLLEQWVATCGFGNVRIVDINQTSTKEQRTTEWMPFESLPEALDPENQALTIEGWPAPTRALLLASKP